MELEWVHRRRVTVVHRGERSEYKAVTHMTSSKLSVALETDLC